MEVNSISECLIKSPSFLKQLVSGYNESELKKRRIADKWSAHEHACHVCVGEKHAFHKRVELFTRDKHPQIEPFSGSDFQKNYYLNLNINDCLMEFDQLRTRTINLVKDRSADFWHKEATHPEYVKYTPQIMLQHLLMHDYWHFYRIEELLLAKDEYVGEL